MGVLVAEVALRPVDDSDLDALFEHKRDPESVRMAAFVAENPDDRTAFDAHMAKIRTSPHTTLSAVTVDGRLVGSVGRNSEIEETILRLDEPATTVLSDVSGGARQTY